MPCTTFQRVALSLWIERLTADRRSGLLDIVWSNTTCPDGTNSVSLSSVVGLRGLWWLDHLHGLIGSVA
jgi:hypothetical protein